MALVAKWHGVAWNSIFRMIPDCTSPVENASSHGLLYGPAPAYYGHSVESLVLSEQRWVQMAVWSFEGWLVSDSSSNNCFDELAGVG